MVLVNMWSEVLANAPRGFSLSYEAKQRHKKSYDYFNHVISNFTKASEVEMFTNADIVLSKHNCLDVLKSIENVFVNYRTSAMLQQAYISEGSLISKNILRRKFSFHININIDVYNKPCIFIESASNMLLDGFLLGLGEVYKKATFLTERQ